MAVLAADPVADVEGLGTLLGRHGEGVTRQAFLVLVGRSLEVENASHADGDVIGKHLIGAGVLVLTGPDAVLVLRNA